jgi:hypothetical protein
MARIQLLMIYSLISARLWPELMSDKSEMNIDGQDYMPILKLFNIGVCS